MRNHKYFKMWQREGLMMVMEYASAAGILPTHNFKDGTFPRVGQINGETMLNGYKIGDTACFACAMSCGNIYLVKQGKYVGTVTEGPEYESCAMLGLEPRASTTSPRCSTPTSCATSWASTRSPPAA